MYLLSMAAEGSSIWLTLLVEALFTAVFLRVLAGYLHRRDGLHRDVVVMFSTLAVLFVLAVVRQAFGEPPPALSVAASGLLLGQPFLTLRVVRGIGTVHPGVYTAAAAGWGVSVALLVLGGEAMGAWSLLAVVAVFVATEIAASWYLARLAAARTGAPRARLYLAAGATALFAVAIMVAGAGSGNSALAQDAQQAAGVIALASALGYLLAFTPPGWARRAWSSRAAYEVVRQLLQVRPDAPAQEIWDHYAHAVRHATASGAVVVLTCADDQLSEVARVGLPAPGPAPGSGEADCTALIEFSASVDTDDARRPADTPAVALDYARAGGFRFVTVASLRLPTQPAVMLLLSTHRSLFTEDDVHMLGDLAGQVAALSQRADLLSDRDRLTGELSDSVAALTAAGEAKSTFMANMSHELRTPLNAIIGFSDLMRTEPAAEGHSTVPSEWIEHVHSSGQHLLGLINEVLDLAKIESGKTELQCEPVDLPRAVNEVVTSLAALWRPKGLELTVAVGPLRLQADRMRLRQIITNLLSNAIKFTPDQGKIFIVARRVGRDIALSVADTGPGIAVADQLRVFEEFQQVGDQRSRSGGTGLGLALTRRLVDAHGGRVELQSEPGRGAKFIVYLPAADRVEPGRAVAPASCGGVLVIEDDRAAADLLSTQLQRAGYQVTVATSGEEGLEAARACDPEAILLDIQLPGVDGWQVLAELKSDDRLRHIPVVIISVHDATDFGLALGAVDYFVKPVDRSTLITWLARHGLIPPGTDRELTVLAIDDDPHSLDLIHASLQGEGIDVVKATGGVDGLRAARRHHVDLIICDLLMPDLDGFDVVAALHNDPDTRGIPVVVLTAHTLTEADKTRLSGKVIAITDKTSPAEGLPDLVRTIGELTGLTIDSDVVVA